MDVRCPVIYPHSWSPSDLEASAWPGDKLSVGPSAGEVSVTHGVTADQQTKAANFSAVRWLKRHLFQ